MRIATSMILASLCVASAPVLRGADADAKPDGYRVLATHLLGGDGGWDLLTIDAAARRLYIARATRVMVVDADTGKLIGEIPGSGVHGVAVVPETKRGFITNGKDNNVTVFDLETLAVVGHAATGNKPDAIIYDAASKHVFVCDNGGSELTVLAPGDGQVQGSIPVGGAPELVALDGKGRLYTNLEDKNQVGVVDTMALKLVATWPLAPGEEPTGLAIDTEHHRLFSACRGTKTMEVFDTETGKVVASPPIGAGVDGAAFDALTGDVFSPNGGDGTLTVIHEDGPTAFTVVQTLATKAGARTIAFDEKTRHLYLVTAERKPADPATAGQKQRPQFVPGTFSVLVVGH